MAAILTRASADQAKALLTCAHNCPNLMERNWTAGLADDDPAYGWSIGLQAFRAKHRRQVGLTTLQHEVTQGFGDW